MYRFQKKYSRHWGFLVGIEMGGFELGDGEDGSRFTRFPSIPLALERSLPRFANVNMETPKLPGPKP